MHSTFTYNRVVRTSNPMDTTNPNASNRTDGLKPTIQEFLGRGQKSGNYRAALERVLIGSNSGSTGSIQPFREFLTNREIDQPTEIDKKDLAAYAEHLADVVDDAQDRDTTTDGISAATAWTYYDYVSAFLAYCVEWEYLGENPARKGLATDQLPPRPTQKTDEADFWTSAERTALLRFVDQRADQALDV